MTLDRHPFGWIDRRARFWLWLCLLVLALTLSQTLGRLGEPLTTDAAPAGIVSFELARTAEMSGAILASWPAAARENAMLLQGLDFLYLAVYPLLFSLSAVLLGQQLPAGWRRAALGLAWLVLLTAPLDAIENVALIQQLSAGPAAAPAQLAWLCATVKFGLLAAAAIFLGLAWLVWLARRLGISRSSQ